VTSRRTWGLVARRALHALAVLAGAATIVFLAGDLFPGDAAETVLQATTDQPAPARVEAWRRQIHLDRSLPWRYLRWMRHAATGDFGLSWRTGEPVARMVADRAGTTARLAAAAFALLVILGASTGALAAARSNRPPDTWLRALAVLAVSVPPFVLGTLLIVLFGVWLGWFPFVGPGGAGGLIMPAVTLAAGIGFTHGRVFRTLLVEAMGRDHVRFGYAAGLSTRAVWRRRLVPGVLPAMVSLWALSLGQLLGGSLVVETVFSWPGLGRLAVDSLLARDLPVFQGCVLAMTLAYVVTAEAAWLLHLRLDPRLAGTGPTWAGQGGG